MTLDDLYLLGDEDTGVSLDCRLCNRRGLPVAYYSHPDDKTYAGRDDVVRVSTIAGLVDAGEKHLREYHHERREGWIA